MHNEMCESDLRVYALSQRSASPEVMVLLLSHRCAIQSELREGALQRNLWGSFYLLIM